MDPIRSQGGPSAPDLKMELYRSLSLTVGLLRRQKTDLLRQHGLSEPQYEAMSILRECSPGALTCGEIGTRMLTRDPDVTRLLNRLEERGFAERARALADRRVVSAQLTTLGLATVISLEGPLMEWRERQLRALGEEEADRLLRQLSRIRG